MFCFIITLITYLKSFTVSKNKRIFDIPTKFEFESGGNFTVKVNKCNNDELLLIITTQDKIDQFMKEQDMQRPCNTNLDYAHHIKINDSKGEISGIINDKGVYVSKILSCKYFVNEYQIKVQFQNPNTFLSLNYATYLQFLPITVFISFFLLFIWLMNSLIYDCSMTNKNHVLLSISFILYDFKVLFGLFMLKQKDKSDNENDYKFPEFVYQTFQVLFCFIFSFVILTIVNDNRKNMSYILVVIVFNLLIFEYYAVITCVTYPCMILVWLLLLFGIILHLNDILSSFFSNNTDDEITYFLKKPHYFLKYSLIHILVSETLLVFDIYLNFYILLGIDCSTKIILCFIGFIYRIRKETLVNYNEIDMDLTPNFL